MISPLPVYEVQQLQAGETLPHYSMHDQPRRSSDAVSDAAGRFVTPPDSPRNTLGGGDRPSEEAQSYADDGEGKVDDAGETNDAGRHGGTELAEAGVASAGILGGVAAGWRRLTMGQYAWVPGASPSRNQRAASSSHRDSSVDLDDLEGRISHDHPQRNVSEDSSRLIHQRRASRIESSEAGLAPEVRSQHASVYGASIGGHQTSGSLPHASSKEASGSSGEQAREAVGTAAQRSHPSLSSQSSSARSRGGGYAASHSNSSGRRTTSDNSGLDSLSAVAQLSSQSVSSGSSRSGYRSSNRGGGGRRSGGALSEVSLASGASTGAASYSPSGGGLSRGNTASTREGTAPTGNATYHASGYSGEASSLMAATASEAEGASSRATGGSSVLDKRKRPRSSSGDGLSRLDSLREVREAPSDPFDEASAAVPPLPAPTGGHYPSNSLGAAVARSAARDSQQQHAPASTNEYLQSQALPQRSRIRSLQPSTPAPAATALAPSLSTPSLGSTSRTDLDTTETSHLTAGIPASASWRPSPRVASASQRAAEAQAALMRAQQQQERGGGGGQAGSGAGGPTPPRSLQPAGEGEGGNRGASFSWAQRGDDLESAQQEGAPGAAADEADTSSRSFDWPKLFRF